MTLHHFAWLAWGGGVAFGLALGVGLTMYAHHWHRRRQRHQRRAWSSPSTFTGPVPPEGV